MSFPFLDFISQNTVHILLSIHKIYFSLQKIRKLQCTPGRTGFRTESTNTSLHNWDVISLILSHINRLVFKKLWCHSKDCRAGPKELGTGDSPVL